MQYKKMTDGQIQGSKYLRRKSTWSLLILYANGIEQLASRAYCSGSPWAYFGRFVQFMLFMTERPHLALAPKDSVECRPPTWSELLYQSLISSVFSLKIKIYVHPAGSSSLKIVECLMSITSLGFRMSKYALLLRHVRVFVDFPWTSKGSLLQEVD